MGVTTKDEALAAMGRISSSTRFVMDEIQLVRQYIESTARDAERWRWFAGDCDGDSQDDLIQYLSENVASLDYINAWADTAIAQKDKP